MCSASGVHEDLKTPVDVIATVQPISFSLLLSLNSFRQRSKERERRCERIHLMIISYLPKVQVRTAAVCILLSPCLHHLIIIRSWGDALMRERSQ